MSAAVIQVRALRVRHGAAIVDQHLPGQVRAGQFDALGGVALFQVDVRVLRGGQRVL